MRKKYIVDGGICTGLKKGDVVEADITSGHIYTRNGVPYEPICR